VLYQMGMLPMALGDHYPPFFAFFIAFHIFIVSKHRDFIFRIYRLIVASPSLRIKNCPCNGRGYVTWPVFMLDATLARYMP